MKTWTIPFTAKMIVTPSMKHGGKIADPIFVMMMRIWKQELVYPQNRHIQRPPNKRKITK
jgi:hypothetical protein